MLSFFQTTTTTGDLLEQGKDLVDGLLGNAPEQVQETVETIKANPVLAAVLIGIGVLTLGIFLWGIVKQAFKAAIVGGLLSAGAWFWYFNIR
jgi:hypothetical protein